MKRLVILAAILIFIFALQNVSSLCIGGNITDSDNDAFNCISDCNDNNAFIFPTNSNHFCDCDELTFGFAEGTNEFCNDGYDNDCDGVVDEINCTGCTIAEASWSKSGATEGDIVLLKIKTENCIEKTLGVKIYNYLDNTTGDLIFSKNVQIFNESFETEWGVEWGADLQGNSTKYIFVANADGSSKDSDLINIIKKEACEENWKCSDWGNCVGGKRYRICTDNKSCRTEIKKPIEQETCQVTTKCSNNKRDEDELGIDCGGACSYGREADCSDGSDNDKDCKVDCDDADCKEDIVCGGEEFILKDIDGDGLSDEREAKIGTNPFLKDTDNDKIDDNKDELPLCPNNSCDSSYGETEENCPQDCKAKASFLPFIIILLILIGSVFAAYIFIKKPFKKKIPFKIKTDLEKLKKYIKEQLEKKVPVDKIVRILIGKKWKKEQIIYALKEIKKDMKKTKK